MDLITIVLTRIQGVYLQLNTYLLVRSDFNDLQGDSHNDPLTWQIMLRLLACTTRRNKAK